MKTIFAAAFGAALLVTAGSTSALAGQISTPIIFLGGGTQLVCVGSNVSSAAITMTVRIVGGTSDASSTCTLGANNRNGCQTFLNGQLGHCRITVTAQTTAQVQANVRGVMFNRIIVSPFTIFETVDAH